MKFKNIIFLTLLLGLFGCSDKMEQSDGNQEQTVRVFGSVVSNSRVSFEQKDNVTYASWDNGDEIGLYSNGYENLCYAASLTGAGTVEFKTQGEALKCADGTNVVAYYPYSETVTGMVVPLPQTSNYIWNAMRPFVYAENQVENAGVSLRFKHIYAYLKVTFSKGDLPEWAEKKILNSIEISAGGQNLALSEGYFDLENLDMVMTVFSPSVIVDANNFDLNQGDFSCYIPVLPQAGGQSLSFRFLQTDEGNTECLFSCQKNASTEGLLAGYVYEVALNNEELPMSPQQQKARIDAIGREFVSYIRATDFDEIKNTTRYIKDTFCNTDEKTNTVTTWYDDCLAAITKTNATKDTTEVYEDQGYSSSYLSIYNYHISDITRIYAAAQFVGHFSVKDSLWIKEEGTFDDMQFVAPDEKGNLCTLKMTTSGETKKIYIGESESENWYNFTEEVSDSILYEYQYEWGTDSITGEEVKLDSVLIETGIHRIYKYSYDIDEKTYQDYVYIPETITIEYAQGSTQILKTVISTDHSAIQSERFNVETEDLAITVTSYINGYEFVVNKASYAAGKNAEVAFKMNKNGQNLITLSAYSDGVVSGDIYDETTDAVSRSLNLDSWSNAYLNIDVLHQMQLKLTCTDGTKFEEYIDLADANDTDETIFKNNLSEANNLIEGGLYFDGQSTKQSWVTLEAFQETDYGSSYWVWEPVLNFVDGSSYSTFSAFFNEDDFKTLINLAWDVFDDFETLAKKFAR